MHMKKIRTFILITLTAFPAGMAAQAQPQDSTLNRTVVVEQEYAPNIRDAAKINAVPAVEAPVVQPKAVEYDNRLQPAGDIPAENMQAYAGRQKLSKATPGYLRLGYGNYGNLDIRKGGYLIVCIARQINCVRLAVKNAFSASDLREFKSWALYGTLAPQ